MEVRVNSGFLMKNTKKESETHPDYTGTWADDDGTEYYLNAWLNTSSKSGSKYFKITRGKAKVPRQDVAPAPAAVTGLDDDIPF
jgi:hypothetical protein